MVELIVYYSAMVSIMVVVAACMARSLKEWGIVLFLVILSPIWVPFLMVGFALLALAL